MILVTSQKLYAQLRPRTDFSFVDSAALLTEWPQVKDRLKDGESLFFLGTENIDALKELWVFTDDGNLQNGRWENTAVGFDALPLKDAPARFIHVRPTGTYAIHGVDEEPRMDIVPLLRSTGRYGNLRGYPAVLLKNRAASLTGGHYAGGCWFVFAIDDPVKALAPGEWDEVLQTAAAYAGAPLFLSKVQPEYALYYADERVRIDYRVDNRSDALCCFTLDIEALDADGRSLGRVITREGAVTAGESCEDSCDWYPRNLPNGVVTLRASLRLHDRMRYGERREQEFTVVDVVETGLLMQTQPLDCPRIEVKGEKLLIDGREDFFIGTHLYPSSDFFELSYRPVRVLELQKGIRAMVQAGVKFCRIWSDPVLDETSIRGMETVVRLFAANGIAVNFMFFSSWTHYMAINTPEIQERFEVARMTDERLIGLYMDNMPQQKAFVSILAKRWKELSHIVWDFSNEFSVVDPDERHLSADWIDPRYKQMEKPYDNIDVFEQWALQIKAAIRESGNDQPVVFGVSCWDTGSENYRCSKQADLVANHGYYLLEQVPAYLYLSNSACIGKPQYMEEFGGTWTDQRVRAGEYDCRLHYFLGCGDDVGMNYEWGVLWLCDELSGTPPYLKFKADVPEEQLDDYVHGGRYAYGKSWADGGTGLCPWIASFEYASSYNCMDNPSPTSRIMRRVADLGRGLSKTLEDKTVYLVLPFEVGEFTKNHGYIRNKTAIEAVVRKLLRLGVDFNVWQEDELGRLPDTARILLFPNEAPVKPAVQRLLDAAAQKGARIYYGTDFSWESDAELPILCTAPQEDVQIMTRDTDMGKLAVLVAPGMEAKTVALAYENTAVSCGLLRAGAVLFDGGVKRAEFAGELAIDGTLFARLEGAGGEAQKVLLSVNDCATMQESRDLSVFAYGAGVLTLNAAFSAAEVLDHQGTVVARFAPCVEQGKTTLTLCADDAFYEVRLKA